MQLHLEFSNLINLTICLLNSNIKSIVTKDFTIKDNTTINAYSTLSFKFDTSLVTIEGYERIAWFPYSYGQNYIQLSVNFVGNDVYLTVTNEYSTALTADLHIYITYIKK